MPTRFLFLYLITHTKSEIMYKLILWTFCLLLFSRNGVAAFWPELVKQILAPLEARQILVVFPSSSTEKAPSQPLLQAVNWLSVRGRPFQLFTKRTVSGETCPLPHHGRYGPLQVTWLTAIQVQFEHQTAELHEAHRNIAIWGYRFIRALNIYKDIVNVIIDSSNVKQWEGQFKISTSRCLIPANFLIYSWPNSPSEKVAAWYTNAQFVGVFCSNGEPTCFMPFPKNGEDITTAAQMDLAIEDIRKLRMNFNRFTIATQPFRPMTHNWQYWQRTIQIPLQKAAGKYQVPLGKLFAIAASVHNFTFRSERSSKSTYADTCNEGSIRMAENYQTHSWIRGSFFPPLSPREFMPLRTFFGSELSQNSPFLLSTFRAPLALRMATALATTIALFTVAFIRMITRGKKRDTFGGLLLVLFAMVNQTSVKRVHARQAPLYALWIVVIGFLSANYTNTLQSLLVAPGLKPSGMSFEEMLEQNFTISTTRPMYQ